MKLEVKNFPEVGNGIEESDYEQLYQNACKLAERYFKEVNQLGYGQTAKTYMTTNESQICLKRLRQEELLKYPFMNSLEEEARLLERVHALIQEGDNIRVPLPIVVINSTRKELVEKENLKGEIVKVPQTIRDNVLAMEQINGPSLADIFKPKEPRFKRDAPVGIDWGEFFDKLKKFVIKMNEAGIYHRDLHMGNIMLDLDTNWPAIIDFGFSRRKHFDDENVYLEKTHPMYAAKFIPDLDMIDKIRSEVLDFY